MPQIFSNTFSKQTVYKRAYGTKYLWRTIVKLENILKISFSKTTRPITCYNIKPRLHCPGVQSWLSSLTHRGPPGSHRSYAGEQRIELGYTVLNRRSPGIGPGGFIFLINRDSPGRTGLRNNAGLFQGITVALPA